MANLPSAQAPRVSYALYFRDCRAEFSVNLDSSDPGYEWIIVPLCFVVIYYVPLFYFRLGNVVAKELRQNSK
jgi:hypothetical protein